MGSILVYHDDACCTEVEVAVEAITSIRFLSEDIAPVKADKDLVFLLPMDGMVGQSSSWLMLLQLLRSPSRSADDDFAVLLACLATLLLKLQGSTVDDSRRMMAIAHNTVLNILSTYSLSIAAVSYIVEYPVLL